MPEDDKDVVYNRKMVDHKIQQLLDDFNKSKNHSPDVLQKIEQIDSQNKKEKMYDNFESLVKYSETLMRHDDKFIAKKR